MRRIKTHPGEILRVEFMEPLGLTVDQLAEDLGVDVGQVAEILEGVSPVTGELAVALAEITGTSAEFWLSLQANHSDSVNRC